MPAILSKWNWPKMSRPDLPDLLSRIVRYRTALILLVITVLAYQTAGIFYKSLNLWLLRSSASTRTAAPASVTAAGKESRDAYRIIPERNLFGSADRSPGGAAGASESAAALEVRGTVAGDPKYAFAIIEDKSRKKQKLYRVGDMAGGARVVRIMRNAVALRIDDREQVLRVPETSEKPILPERAETGAAVPGPTATPLSDGTIAVSRSEIETGLKDMGTMLSQAQIRPYFSGGAPDGFIISNIKSGSIYQKIGLNNGDIIQGINDRHMKTADDIMELYNVMKSGTNVALRINRQGRQETFQYVFR
jgi:general secretion pathway protein C